MSARAEVLARIAAAHRSAPPPTLAYADIARRYRRSSDQSGAELIERLTDRLLDYKALVRRCGPAEVRETIRTALTERGLASLAVPAGLPADWLELDGIELRRERADRPLSVDELDATDGVLTGCAVAIAETGTLVLDGSAGMGRRVLSLISDYHLCVLGADQVVADVPQALPRLDPTRPLTLISGPSATSDIELNRVEGVHGPRTLEVVVVG